MTKLQKNQVRGEIRLKQEIAACRGEKLKLITSNQTHTDVFPTLERTIYCILFFVDLT